jgi:hypothetical protein
VSVHQVILVEATVYQVVLILMNVAVELVFVVKTLLAETALDLMNVYALMVILGIHTEAALRVNHPQLYAQKQGHVLPKKNVYLLELHLSVFAKEVIQGIQTQGNAEIPTNVLKLEINHLVANMHSV